jgi:3-hydroxyacyl-[acyl-carrier-protein] dehydratase
MKFILIDRALELESGKRIIAVKNLSLAEEYLQDHFPRFPVLPGVLMIEAMIQAAAWLQRVSSGFAQSMVVLDEARNVKYGSFFHPGTTMRVEVELLKQEPGGLWKFKGQGSTGEAVNVQGRFTLRAFNLAEQGAALAETDQRIIEAMKARWAMIAPRSSTVTA